MKITIKDVKKLIKDVETRKRDLQKDERSRAAYWNCDDWGSISGFREAEEWVQGKIDKLIERRIKNWS